MEDRTEEERDILREVGNIGGGNALTSLSMMLNRPLDLDVPVCRVVNRNEAGTMLKNPEALYAGISMKMAGTVECVLALLMNKQFTKLVVDTLDMEGQVFDVEGLTDMQKSTLCEVGNIMGNSYINALGALLNMHIDVSVPSIVIDTGDRVLEGVLESHAMEYERIMFIGSSFKTEDKILESYMLLCPSSESLSVILDRLSF